MMRKIFFIAIAALWAAALFPAASRAAGTPYAPSSGDFSCLLPPGWTAFEEEGGALVHILGPQSPLGDYRAGIDIEFMQDGGAGFVPYEKEIDYLRNGGAGDHVDSTLVQALRISGTLGRYFESNVTRVLPDDRLPAAETTLHHFTAFVPVTREQSYYLIDLSSSESTYLNYRGLFMEFLKSFQTRQ
ncbi:MAG TPA: hypothetical protein VNH15_04215 [Elusimicrobiota bacterium]|nr:hypothetical protein [Elusimicrobiota bacterium]